MLRLGRLVRPLTIAAVFALAGCQQGGDPYSAVPLGSPTAPTRLADYHGDPAATNPVPPYDHGPPAVPPDAAPVPPAAPPLAPGPLPPDGTAVAVAIVGFSGPASFMPNPTTAAVGSTVIWTNNDVTRHHIVLFDGTVVGDLAPGQSSAPVPVNTPTVGFTCTIHPSMVGTLYDPALAAPPIAEPPPAYDYQDPYSDDYGSPDYRY